MALCYFSFQKRSLCIVSQNHKLKSLCPISLAKSSSLHLDLSSVVFASQFFSWLPPDKPPILLTFSF
ncbi:hypothetical protein Bca4012_029869 [Brassica carinata]